MRRKVLWLLPLWALLTGSPASAQRCEELTPLLETSAGALVDQVMRFADDLTDRERIQVFEMLRREFHVRNQEDALNLLENEAQKIHTALNRDLNEAERLLEGGFVASVIRIADDLPDSVQEKIKRRFSLSRNQSLKSELQRLSNYYAKVIWACIKRDEGTSDTDFGGFGFGGKGRNPEIVYTTRKDHPRGFQIPYADTAYLKFQDDKYVKYIHVRAHSVGGSSAFFIKANGRKIVGPVVVPERDPSFDFEVNLDASTLQITADRAPETARQGTLVIDEVTVFGYARQEAPVEHQVVYRPKPQIDLGFDTGNVRHSRQFRNEEAYQTYRILKLLQRMEQDVDDLEEATYLSPAVKAASEAFTVFQHNGAGSPQALKAAAKLRRALADMKPILERWAEIDNLWDDAIVFRDPSEEIDSLYGHAPLDEPEPIIRGRRDVPQEDVDHGLFDLFKP